MKLSGDINRDYQAMAEELARAFYPHGREEVWARISAMAGMMPNGDILPPETIPSQAVEDEGSTEGVTTRP